MNISPRPPSFVAGERAPLPPVKSP
ncbi:uncharacterized protein G2W53_033342 [Senna tora]|uniref:Uncharacterized protein n=1 Tax=Senna tora TaxID=362788 RepID=A0A834SZ41_9FABA|nr:uncharacterized protein G2W53_033342 [Senna tora]